LLERVPSEKGTWKPHPKSFALGHLAQLLARMPGWMTAMLRDTEINLATYPGYSIETTPSLLAEFDRNVRAARQALAAAKDADFTVVWSLKHGDRVLMALPRRDVVRTHINHLVRSEEHTSELQSRFDLVCRLLLEKKDDHRDV